jgi:hypothetical protein
MIFSDLGEVVIEMIGSSISSNKDEGDCSSVTYVIYHTSTFIHTSVIK